MTEASIESPGAFVSGEWVSELLERCAADWDAPDFGLRVALSTDISILGPLALVMAHARTPRAALHLAQRSLHRVNSAWRITLSHQPDGTFVGLHRADAKTQSYPQFNELALLDCHRIICGIAGRAEAPRTAQFLHKRISPLTRYKETFGVAPSFLAAEQGLLYADSFMNQLNPARNERLAQIAQRYLEIQRPIPTEDIVAQVRALLGSASGAPDWTQRVTSARLGVSERTLQRRLREQGVTFDQVREAARREAAKQHLARGERALSDISRLLGYTDPSAFTRSCRRWFGMSPTAMRESLSGQHRRSKHKQSDQ